MMHPFATDSNERIQVIFLIALISVLFAWVLGAGIQYWKIHVPWWAEAPSLFTFFGVLYKWWDGRIWRFPVFHKIGLVKIPDLNGDWKGDFHTSFDNHAFSHPASMKIKQSWTKLLVTFQSNSSKSHSLTGSILTNQPEGTTLSYEYLNEPRTDAKDSMHIHRGTAVLRLGEKDKLDGQYYTGRDRVNFGNIMLKKT